jgi:signal transduction histidine kinase
VKDSIRLKLLGYMLTSVLLFSLLLFVANTFLVERYYLEKNKSTLLKSEEQIAALLKGVDLNADEGWFAFSVEQLNALGDLERRSGQTVYIGTLDGRVVYPVYTFSIRGSTARTALDMEDSRPLTLNVITKPRSVSSFTLPALPRDPASAEGAAGMLPRLRSAGRVSSAPVQRGEKNSFFLIGQDTILKTSMLIYQSHLDNGLILQVSRPMSAIDEGAAIANHLSSLIGMITIVFTIFWAIYVSRKFTRPIQQMNAITERMRRLDFSEAITVQGQDEIAQLSGNINALSASLHATIDALNEKNCQLEADIDRERAIDQMRRNFISNVSHELKTPIFLIQGYADGLKTNVIRDEEKKNFYCEVIVEEADKMDVLVKDLLDLARLEAGSEEIRRSAFMIGSLIQSVTDKYKITLREKGVVLRAAIPEGVQVYADPFQIEQVLTNFMNNAIEHAEGDREIRISAEQDQGQIRILIYNTGRPISEPAITKVWDSFYKADQARTRELGGAGLGLAIVKAILERHGSAFGVYNCEQGVVFYFDLDIVTDAAADCDGEDMSSFHGFRPADTDSCRKETRSGEKDSDC